MEAVVESMGGKPDVILAADVVAGPYAAAIPSLIHTVETLLLPSPSSLRVPTFMLAYQRRDGESEATFFSAMESRGWDCALVPRKELHHDFREMSGDTLRPLRLYAFTKR